MTPDELLGDLPFDLYERYILLDRIGELFRPAASPYRVLELGAPEAAPGAKPWSAALIPNAAVTVASVDATAPHLPFPDDSFDLVCSLDSLEYLSAENRVPFLSELLRVTRDGLYLASPVNSAGNRWARSLVSEYARVAFKHSAPDASVERPHFGLPDRGGISRFFAGSPYCWIEFSQGNTDVWLLMMLTYQRLRLAGPEFVSELNRRFNQAYAGQDWAEPCYRAGYLLSKKHTLVRLEQLRASFHCCAMRADLQSILALCQLLVSIAQNARVPVDLHGQNRAIQARFAEARIQWEKSDRTAAALERLESQVIKYEAEMADVQRRVDNRMRDLEIGLVTNKRAVQAIYDSRIWKTMAGIGGFLLRLTGRAAHHGYRPAPAPQSQARPPASSETARDVPILVCDYPAANAVEPMRDVVEIRGWALAESGIDRVEIRIGNQPPAAATYGVARPDVARNYRHIAGAEHSGFRFFWDTAGLPEGPYTLRITALSRNGESCEIARDVSVDWNTSPGYAQWIARHEPSAADLRLMRREAAALAMKPAISIVVPVYKTPLSLLTACIESVIAQTYPNWELCLCDDGSNDATLAGILHKYVETDARIRLAILPKNSGISAATNQALSLATGDFIAFLDHDDELAPFALTEVVRAIQAHPDTELFYSDEDKIDAQGRRYDAFFKPGWSPDLFLSYNYICHFVAMKRTLIDQIGRLDIAHNGAQDYEFLLRAIEHTGKIRRIPKILYHWRAIPGSTAMSPDDKPSAGADGERALAAYLRRNAPGAGVEQVGPCRYRVRYAISGRPRVSILIPTAGHKTVYRAVDDVLAKTAYHPYEIVLIDNSRGGRISEAVARWAARPAPVRHFDWRGQPFNFSRMNNAAVQSVESPYVLFLNDDTSIITPEWLSAMLEHAQRPEIGAVGAQLWYPNDLIQHAGVVMGLFGNCSHAFKNLPGGESHYFDLPNLIRDTSAVTAACMLVSRDKFLQAGRFDESNLAIAFQDVDLCLKLLELGYRNVYTPYARLYHYESATKSEEEKIPDPAEDAFMKKKWAKYIADDPYYNPNLARRREDFSLSLD